MKVSLNQPIMRDVLEKFMGPMESDGLTESLTEDSTDEYLIMKRKPVKRARKGLKRLKSKTGSKAVNFKVIKSKMNTVMTSLAKVSHPNESGQGDRAAPGGEEKENLIPPMLLAGLISSFEVKKKRKDPGRYET